MPRISAIQDFRYPSLIRADSLDFDELIQETFKQVEEKVLEIRIYLGCTQQEGFLRISSLLFNLLQTPLLKARFVKKEKKWLLKYIKPINHADVPDEDKDLLRQCLGMYFAGKNTLEKVMPAKSTTWQPW